MGQEEVCDATVQAPFRLARIGKHVFIYGSGVLLGKAVAFVMLPIYTRYLTPADYGILQLTDLTIEVISIVAGSRAKAGTGHNRDHLDRQVCQLENAVVRRSEVARIDGQHDERDGLAQQHPAAVDEDMLADSSQAKRGLDRRVTHLFLPHPLPPDPRVLVHRCLPSRTWEWRSWSACRDKPLSSHTISRRRPTSW